jgi:transmembrane protein 132
LRYFSSTDYLLDVQSHNVHAVVFGDRPAPDTPRLVAVGPGKGQLVKVSLEPPEACQRKKSPRALAAADVSLDIDFSRPGDLQSDAAPAVSAIFQDSSASNAASANQPRTGSDASSSSKTAADRKPALHLSLNDRRKTSDENASAAQHSRSDVQMRYAGSMHAASGQQMSALEVSMYTLLGVFCVAVVVFSVNCAVFVARYRRRRKGLRGDGLHGDGPEGDVDIDKDDPENCAPDWVWIGRETLERNAINTGCSEALMPEADFNGNHAATGSVSAVIVDGSSSSTTSGYGNSGSSGLGLGLGLGTAGGGAVANNRSSYISTYKGERMTECIVWCIFFSSR